MSAWLQAYGETPGKGVKSALADELSSISNDSISDFVKLALTLRLIYHKAHRKTAFVVA